MILKPAVRREEMASLRKVAEAATKRKSRKRRYIQGQDMLTVGEVADLIAPKDAGGQEDGKKPVKGGLCTEALQAFQQDWTQFTHLPGRNFRCRR
jgi:hypothetical protein